MFSWFLTNFIYYSYIVTISVSAKAWKLWVTEMSACPVWHSCEAAGQLRLERFAEQINGRAIRDNQPDGAIGRERDNHKTEWPEHERVSSGRFDESESVRMNEVLQSRQTGMQPATTKPAGS